MNTATVRIWLDNHRIQYLAILAITAVVYYASARIGLQLAFEKTNASPVWPPSGIAFALMLMFGKRVWPGIFFGAFLANIYVFSQFGSLPGLVNTVTALSIASGNTLEALIGYWLLSRFTDIHDFSVNLRGVLFFILTSVLMSLVGSILGTSSLVVSGMASADAYLMIWFTWWLGDTMGILVLTFLILSWLHSSSVAVSTTWWIRFSTIGILTIIVASITFFELVMPEFVASLPFLIGPFLLWAAYCCGMRGATMNIFLVSSIAVIGTINGTGAFAGDLTHNALLLLQLFVFVVAISTLALAAAFEERTVMESALRESNNVLENRIAERTSELAKSNKELKEHHEKLEDLVEDRTRQLQTSNRELEAFSYSVSHDLRAPLRCIDGFCHIIEDDYQDRLDETGLDYFRRVRQASQRLGTLIDDILQLSRVTLEDINRQHVNLSDMAELVARDLKDSEPDRNVEFKIEPDIIVNADNSLLNIVLMNLIGNSLKFTSGLDSAVIKLSSKKSASETIISIKDNGVGLDMKYIDKLFKPFQRLHGQNFEGSGVGLATVSRIVKRHGGRVWVNSKIKKGSTFYFTLKDNHFH